MAGLYQQGVNLGLPLQTGPRRSVVYVLSTWHQCTQEVAYQPTGSRLELESTFWPVDIHYTYKSVQNLFRLKRLRNKLDLWHIVCQWTETKWSRSSDSSSGFWLRCCRCCGFVGLSRLWPHCVLERFATERELFRMRVISDAESHMFCLFFFWKVSDCSVSSWETDAASSE